MKQITQDEAQNLLTVAITYGELVQRILDNWESGDLAGAINAIEEYRDEEAARIITEAKR
jgi:hypothetical protein